MLLKYAWDNDACFPGQVTLAQDMGAAERSVRTYLKELEERGATGNQAAGPWQDQPVPASSHHSKSLDKLAVPDRQILPFKNGNGSRS